MARGTVKQWERDEGWGVLVSPDVPGEVWAHFMHIEADPEGFRELKPGTPVEFDFIAPPGGQDGYAYRAVWVRRADAEGG